MDTKDIATLAIGGSAFLLSTTAFVQKLYENRRAMRIQLTDTMSELMPVLAEIDVLMYRFDELQDREARVRLGKLRGQLYSLAVQADFFIQKLPPRLIRDVEYANLGNAFWAADDQHRAEFYFAKTVTTAEERHEGEGEEWYFNMRTAKYTKDFANFLFHRGKPVEGRIQYEKAASLLSDRRDQVWMEKGFVFLMWSRSEARVGQNGDALKYRSVAQDSFKEIKNQELQKRSLRELDELNRYFTKEGEKEPTPKP